MATKTKQKVKRTAIIKDRENDRRRFRWVVEFIVDETWVADGFDIDDDRAHSIIHSHIGWSYGHEVDGRVLAAPDRRAIRHAQGYSD